MKMCFSHAYIFVYTHAQYITLSGIVQVYTYSHTYITYIIPTDILIRYLATYIASEFYRIYTIHTYIYIHTYTHMAFAGNLISEAGQGERRCGGDLAVLGQQGGVSGFDLLQVGLRLRLDVNRESDRGRGFGSGGRSWE